jgi:hypothetical protein
VRLVLPLLLNCFAFPLLTSLILAFQSVKDRCTDMAAIFAALPLLLLSFLLLITGLQD